MRVYLQKKQAQAGNLDRQVQRLIKYASDSGYVVSGIYQEIASAVNERRQQLYRMLNRIQNRKLNSSS